MGEWFCSGPGHILSKDMQANGLVHNEVTKDSSLTSLMGESFHGKSNMDVIGSIDLLASCFFVYGSGSVWRYRNASMASELIKSGACCFKSISPWPRIPFNISPSQSLNNEASTSNCVLATSAVPMAMERRGSNKHP